MVTIETVATGQPWFRRTETESFEVVIAAALEMFDPFQRAVFSTSEPSNMR